MNLYRSKVSDSVLIRGELVLAKLVGYRSFPRLSCWIILSAKGFNTMWTFSDDLERV